MDIVEDGVIEQNHILGYLRHDQPSLFALSWEPEMLSTLGPRVATRAKWRLDSHLAFEPFCILPF